VRRAAVRRAGDEGDVQREGRARHPEPDRGRGCEFFVDKRAILKRLASLRAVGLGYLRLGQSTSRCPAARPNGSSSRRSSRRSPRAGRLFLFDEPTTGLHHTDVEQLMKTFRDLIDRGNSVLVIEHNTQLIQAPTTSSTSARGGTEAGRWWRWGRPEEIAANPRSITGRYLFAGQESRVAS